MVAVKVWYKCENDIIVTRITVDGIEFNTDRIKGKRIEIWTSPFFIDGIKWNGFYAEMIKSIKSSNFSVEFHGSDESYLIIKKALDNHFISVSKSDEKQSAMISGTSADTFMILGSSVHIDPKFCIYVKLHNKFVSMARELSQEYLQIYEKRIRNIGDFSCNAMLVYNKIIDHAFDSAVNITINATSETSIDKSFLINAYLYNGTSYINMFNSMCSSMSLEDSAVNSADGQNSQTDKKNNINLRYRIMNVRKFKEICRSDKLAACVCNDIIGIFNFLCVNTRLGEIVSDPGEVRAGHFRANELFRKMSFLTQDDEIREAFVQIFRSYPYNVDYFTEYLRRYCDPDGELARMAAFMNIDISSITDDLLTAKYQCESTNTYEEAVALRDRIIHTMHKYSLDTCSILEKVNVKCDILERTYKGCVYDTAELKKTAQAQDEELSDACRELDSMDHDECLKLKDQVTDEKYIAGISDGYIKKIDKRILSTECEMLDSLTDKMSLEDNDKLDDIRKQILELSHEKNIRSEISSRYIDQVIQAMDKNYEQQLTLLFKDIQDKNSDELDEVIKSILQSGCSQDLKVTYINKVHVYKRALLAAEYSMKIRKVIDSCSDFISIVSSSNDEYIKTETYLSEYISRYSLEADEPVVAYIVLGNVPRVIYTNKRIVSIIADKSVPVDQFIVCEVKKKIFSNQIYFSMKETKDCFCFDIVNNRYAEGLCSFTNLFIQVIQNKNQALDKMCEELDSMDMNELLSLKNNICTSQCSKMLKDIYLAKTDAAIEERKDKCRRSYLAELKNNAAKMDYSQMCQKITGIRNHTDEEYLDVKSFVTEGEALSVILGVKSAADEKKLHEMFANAEKASLNELIALRQEISKQNFMKSVRDKYVVYLDKRICYVQTALRNRTISELKTKLSQIKYEDILIKLKNVRSETDEDLQKYSAFISKDELTMMIVEQKALIEEKILSQKCADLSSLSLDDLKKLRQWIQDSQFIEKTAAPFVAKIDTAAANIRKENHDRYIKTLYEQTGEMDHKQLVSKIHAIMQSQDSIFTDCVPKAEAVAIVNRVKAQCETKELESMFARFEYMSTKEMARLYKTLSNNESTHTFDPETVKPYLKRIEKELKNRDKKGRKKGYTVCPVCGVPAKTGSPFCGACGAKISDD